jgi:hypothetical protein
VFEGHRLPSTESRWDIRWVRGRGKAWFLVYFAWLFWQSVLRLSFMGNSYSDPVVRRQRVPVFEGHRLPSTGSRWDIRWVGCRGKTWFFVCLAWLLWQSVLKLAVRVRVFAVGIFGVRECRCLRGIDCR